MHSLTPASPAIAEDRCLLTAEQLAGYLQVHVWTIRKYIDSGRIPVAAWIGREPRFHRPAVVAALSKRPVESLDADPASPSPPTGGRLARRSGRLGRRLQEQP